MVNSSHCLHSWGTLDGGLCSAYREGDGERDGEEDADTERQRREERARATGPMQQRNASSAFGAGYKLQKKDK